MPETIPDAPGKFQTVAITQLTHHLNIGGAARIGQSAFGYPIAGAMSQKHLVPTDRKDGDRSPARKIFDSAPVRFRGRDAKSGRRNAPLLRGDSMKQVKAVWLSPTTPLSEDGKPMEWRSRRYNVSFRFDVLQAGNPRDCFDLERSMGNLACTVETPIHLPS